MSSSAGSSILHALLLALVACTTTPIPPSMPAPDDAIVDEALSLQLHSAFWINLHHVLYAEAWARRGAPAMQALAQPFPAPLVAPLTADERAAWDRAVAYYDHNLASLDLLFDPQLDAIRLALIGAPAGHPLAGLPASLADVLAAAAPVYRARWWPAHDRANRAWITDLTPRLRAVSPEVPDRLARLYATPWFTTPTRVDVVFVAKRQGAYTHIAPAPHLTISATDPDTQQWGAVESVFHEASHALIDPVRDAFDRELRTAGKTQPALWHVALFYAAGEVVRQALAARAIAYTPYLYATGLFDRAWPALRVPVEAHWRPYIDGKIPLDAAVRAVVAAAP